MDSEKKRPKYVPPQSRNLSDLAVSGGGVHPLGVCTPTGSFPWNGCNHGNDLGTSISCNDGGSPDSPGNNCTPGATPSTGTTQCYPHGTTAGNSCTGGNFA